MEEYLIYYDGNDDIIETGIASINEAIKNTKETINRNPSLYTEEDVLKIYKLVAIVEVQPRTFKVEIYE